MVGEWEDAETGKRSRQVSTLRDPGAYFETLRHREAAGEVVEEER